MAPGSRSGVVILRLKQVQRKTSLSRSAIYEKISLGDFPAPIRLGVGRAVGWIESEIDGWLMAKVAERDARQSRLPAK